MTHLRHRALPLLNRACALRLALALPTGPRTVSSVRFLANTAAQCARSLRPGAKGLNDSLRRPRRGAGADGEAFPSRLLVQDSVEVIRERLSQDDSAQGRPFPSRFSSSAGSRPPEAGWEGGAAPARIPPELMREIGKAEMAVKNAADSVIFAADAMERLAQMLERAMVAQQVGPAAEVDVVEQEVVKAKEPAKAAKTKRTAPQGTTTTTTAAAAATVAETQSPPSMKEAIAGLGTMVLEKEEGNAEEQPATEDAEMARKQMKKALKREKALRKAERRAKQAAHKKARLDAKRERRKEREAEKSRKLEARKHPGSDDSTFRPYDAFGGIDPEEHDGADEEEAEVAAADEDEDEEAAADEGEVEVVDADEDEAEVAEAGAEEEVEAVVAKPLTMGEKRRARNEAAAAKREAGKVRAQARRAKVQAFRAKRAEQKQSRRASREAADRGLSVAAEEEIAKALWPDDDVGKP